MQKRESRKGSFFLPYIGDAFILRLGEKASLNALLEGDARGKRYGNICICITDSLCYKAEANTPL